MHKILIADDEPDCRTLLCARLRREGYSVVAAQSAEDAFLAALDSQPDLVLADVSMPGGGGVALCRRLRQDRRTAALPILLLSGVNKRDLEQAEGIERGADDYLLKPWSDRLLIAKIRALLRRGAASPGTGLDVLKASGLVLDVAARTASCSGRRLELSRKEFDLLATLLRKRGRVLSVPYLLETVWGYDPADYSDPHTLQTHLSVLRRKLGPGFKGKFVSVRGMGYRYEE